MINANRHDELPGFYFRVAHAARVPVSAARRNLLSDTNPSGAPPDGATGPVALPVSARRHGLIGCNFALNRIPVEARIQVVRTTAIPSPPRSGGEGQGEVARFKSPLSGSLPAQSRGESVVIVPPEEVREKFKRVKPLKEIGVKERGWTLDVLNAIRRLVSEGRALRDPNISSRSGARGTRPSDSFTTADTYAFARELGQLHPDNRPVRENPVKDFVSRGKNSSATPSPTP